MEPGLYIVGTPIGNLGDITYRAVETLKEVDLILAEDTRHSRRLLNHYDIRKPMTSCHKFNEAQRSGWLVQKIEQGAAVALISNAGMPAVSDPGARSVQACRAAGLPVRVVPGPTAVSSAVALSGWGGRAFRFEGFLPPKSGARQKRLEALLEAAEPVVIYEAPYKILRLLGELSACFGEREMVLCRELTKKFEECRAGTAAELAASFGEGKPRGEIALVIAPADRRRRSPDRDD